MAVKNVFAAAQDELAYPGAIGTGTRGMAARRLQEWLTFHKFATPIDGIAGPATIAQLNAYQASVGEPQKPTLTNSVWGSLVAPLAGVLTPVDPGPHPSVSALTLRYAQQHLAAAPIELGGENRGPWVRAYMDGNDGSEYPWCAGFVTFVLAQSCAQLDVAMPVPRTYSCDTLGISARHQGRLVTSGRVDWNGLGACQIFLVQIGPNDWSHTGFSYEGAADQTFSTIEGNSNDNGSQEGYEVVKRKRSLPGKCLISLD